MLLELAAFFVPYFLLPTSARAVANNNYSSAEYKAAKASKIMSQPQKNYASAVPVQSGQSLRYREITIRSLKLKVAIIDLENYQIWRSMPVLSNENVSEFQHGGTSAYYPKFSYQDLPRRTSSLYDDIRFQVFGDLHFGITPYVYSEPLRFVAHVSPYYLSQSLVVIVDAEFNRLKASYTGTDKNIEMQIVVEGMRTFYAKTIGLPPHNFYHYPYPFHQLYKEWLSVTNWQLASLSAYVFYKLKEYSFIPYDAKNQKHFPLNESMNKRALDSNGLIVLNLDGSTREHPVTELDMNIGLMNAFLKLFKP